MNQGTAVFIGTAMLIIYIFSAIAENIDIIMIVILSGFGIIIAYQIYTEIYFGSEKFNHIKKSIRKHAENCNELNHYIEELKGSYVNIESYNYGTGQMVDSSVYDFKRREWNNDIQNNQIHHCSATICKGASNQPIKYLCKYFDIEKNEDSLARFEKVLNDFTSVEQGKDLMKKERELVLMAISESIPFLIQQLSKKKLLRKLGFEKVDISDTYIPTFTFQYVSAGGNSSLGCDIKLNIENLNHLIHYLNDLIKWRNSVAGQRALMTSALREEIKKRDNYQCCFCSLGIKDEQHLLLEIDHKIPISKGGMTTYDNLQTLCWKCNRKKGANILD